MRAFVDQIEISNIPKTGIQYASVRRVQPVLQNPRHIVAMGDSKNASSVGIERWWHVLLSCARPSINGLSATTYAVAPFAASCCDISIVPIRECSRKPIARLTLIEEALNPLPPRHSGRSLRGASLSPFGDLAQANPVLHGRTMDSDAEFRHGTWDATHRVRTEFRDRHCHGLVERIGLHLNGVRNSIRVGERHAAAAHEGIIS